MMEDFSTFRELLYLTNRYLDETLITSIKTILLFFLKKV